MDASRTFVVAEAGVNHNGKLENALRLVDVAAKAAADAVKFQTFSTSHLATQSAPKAEYQRTSAPDKSQFDMLRALELDEEEHCRIASACADAGIEFMSTAFDSESLRMLVGLNIRRIKIASGDITNGPLLLQAARSGLPVILSSGMATLEEIRDALSVITWGVCDLETPGALERVREHYRERGTGTLLGRVSILHCCSAYPTPMPFVNLRAMDTIGREFGLPVGLSDHTTGISVPIAAVALGAAIVEKHITLDRSMPGPDHAASLEPGELAQMVRSIREVEEALGDGRKLPTQAEEPNRGVARRGLYAARDITCGEVLQPADLEALRPATETSPMWFWDLVGRPASHDLKHGQAVTLNRD